MSSNRSESQSGISKQSFCVHGHFYQPPREDPFTGRISNDSPVGRALIGAKVGESVMADTPAGALEFKVLSVTKAE